MEATYKVHVVEANTYEMLAQKAETVVKKFTTANPLEAEALYFKYCTKRSEGVGAVMVFSSFPDIVPSAYYRTDRNWPRAKHREQEYPRQSQIWAKPPEAFLSPTPLQLQGALSACGWSQAKMARELGLKDSRTVRYWLATTGRQIKISYCEWHTFLCKSGFLNP